MIWNGSTYAATGHDPAAARHMEATTNGSGSEEEGRRRGIRSGGGDDVDGDFWAGPLPFRFSGPAWVEIANKGSMRSLFSSPSVAMNKQTGP
jgi:hypothetical protein